MTRPVFFLILGVAVALLGVSLAVWGPDAAAVRSVIASLAGWRDDHPFLLGLLYFLAYVAVTTLSLPIAVWMTLGAGALFGFLGGVLIVALAATAGATGAFLAARYFLRDAVRRRAGDRLSAIDAGIRRDGALYLFSLRLIPAVPFFLVNLLMGLTAIPAGTFAAVSFIGMLPATALYVNAGTQLAAIGKPGDILSPGIVISLLLLGLFPWLARSLFGLVRRRRLRKAWRRPARFDRNLVVIGAGSAGLVSAYIAAAVKAKVTLVEKHRMGGDCLNTGCVPSKAIIATARMAHRMRSAGRLGLSDATPDVDFPAVMDRVARVIAEISPNDSPERYRGLGVDVVEGEARIVDPWTVAIIPNDPSEPRRQLTTRAIVIAAGAAPRIPDIPGLDRVGYLTTDTLWARLAGLPAVPERFAILGGGPIGCELAQALARLGSRVTVIEAGERLLAKEDAEAAVLVRAALVREGVEVLTDAHAMRAGRDGGARWIEIAAGDTPRRVVFDELLVAIGRDARLSGFGLEELGIPAGRVIETNEYLETIHPNIFAAGDAAGPFQLTHAGAHQAWFATVNALFGSFWRFRTDYRVIPSAIFTDPEVARVGLTEAEAKARGTGYEVTKYNLAGLDRAVADGATEGFVKVLTAPGRDRILGVTIAGERAGDLIAEFALAMRHRIGLNGILSTVHAYPTRAEANRFVAGEWRKAHVSPRVMAILERYHRWRRG